MAVPSAETGGFVGFDVFGSLLDEHAEAVKTRTAQMKEVRVFMSVPVG
jgi:hypothetical protein